MQYKDYFSGHSSLYAAYRPTYPDTLYEVIYAHLGHSNCAWDCATGNGQVAGRLAEKFTEVFASDISDEQLKNAIQKENIKYVRCPAEHTPFSDRQFDLITVGQALHWFTIDRFYEEVKRVARPGALIGVWGYGLNSVGKEIDPLLHRFYQFKIGPYWDEARKHVEAAYDDLPFPFTRIDTPEIEMSVTWTRDRFLAYLNTWSAVRKYLSVHKINPVDELNKELSPLWNSGEMKKVRFPLFLKLGRIL